MCDCDCMSCALGQCSAHCRPTPPPPPPRGAVIAVVETVAAFISTGISVAIGVARGHAYVGSNDDGTGPCSVCGYGPGAPQHQSGYGLRPLLVSPMRTVAA